MWFLRLHCDKDYPARPPSVAFNSRVLMDCVDARGNVVPAKVPYLATWTAAKTLHGTLTEIKNLLARAPSGQPQRHLTTEPNTPAATPSKTPKAVLPKA